MPAAEATPPPRGLHVPELDGIRGLAILGVMIFHQTAMAPSTRLDHEFIRLAGHLNCGVDLFFVLSGFLITGILYDSRHGDRYYRNFYARRALRIVPLYYAVLAVAFVVLPLFPHPKLEKWSHIHGLGQLWYWLFLSNWSIALGKVGFQHGMVDLSWSLSIEEQFYLTWPLVVRSFSRRRLLDICAGLVVTSLAVRTALALWGAPAIWTLITPARMDALAMGAWVALAARGGKGFAGLLRGTRWVGTIAGVVVAVFVLFPGADGLAWGSPQVIYPTALALLFASLLTLAAGGPRGSWPSALLRGRFLTMLGTLSYGLYLFHNPAQVALRDLLYGPARFPTLLGSPLPGQLLFYVAATIPALALAWLSWHLYEKPWLSLKRFFPVSDSPRASAVRSSPSSGSSTVSVAREWMPGEGRFRETTG